MRKSYVIVESTWEKDSDYMHCGRPDFVFTSKAKAMQQMNVMEYEISHGKWFVEENRAEGEPSKYYIDYCGRGDCWSDEHLYRIVVKRTDLPKRIICFDLYECNTNSGYRLN